MARKAAPLGSRNTAGARIREMRKHRNIKPMELLAKLQLAGVDISAGTLAGIERQNRSLADWELRIFADILRVSPDWLTGKES